MKKHLLITISFLLLSFIGFSQSGKLWNSVTKSSVTNISKSVKRASFPEKFSLFQLNETAFKDNLNSVASVNSSAKSAGTVVFLPNIEGKIERFELFESSNFSPELQAQFPEIRAFAGIGIDDKYAQVRLSVDPNGIQAMIFRTDKDNEFIEPYSQDRKTYAVFNSSGSKSKFGITCHTDDQPLILSAQQKIDANNSLRASNGLYKTMRLALSCNAEYTAFYGGTVAGALAGMNATMTRVNGVFEKELAVHLNLIANEAAIIYTNAATDPYSDIAFDASGNPDVSAWNAQVQATLTSIITNSGYDIGHMFGADGGGGNAGCIGCVCVNGQKGSGITSPGDAIPQGDSFDIDYVVHEMGHQMGANHTFTFSTENNAVNVEPGSGSTIMAYAGITGSTDVQAHSNDYYSYASIEQIQTNLATKTCPVTTTITHGTPSMNAGSDYTIPMGTPFKLVGSGTDSGSNVITYCWEESDDAASISTTAATAATASFPLGTKTDGPNFRSLSPVSVPYRYFPSLQTVLGNSLSSTWEATSTVARTLNFTLTGRDNVVGGGQTGKDATVITVSGTTGPFDVTSQSTSGISWVQGSTETITWTVNGTTTLVGSTNVDILLSTDGGLTFGTTLASGVPNNGSATVTVPNIAAAFCRLMVKPTGNVYYDINSKVFSIGYTLTQICNTYTNNISQPISDGPDPAAPVAGPTTTSVINIPLTQNITDVNVNVNLTHAWIRDLISKVQHPDGTEVVLGSRICNGQQGYNITFNDGAPAIVCGAATSVPAGTYTPSGTLSSFNGKASNGSWSLLINDYFGVDEGDLNSWSVEVCYMQAVLLTDSFGLENFSIYPNPNNGNFTVKFDTTSSNDVSIAVHDMRGREIFSKSYQPNGFFNENLQLSGVQSGVYLVNVQDGNRKEVRKIIVE
jgi:subtilisin-like proprotein convertase family protein